MGSTCKTACFWVLGIVALDLIMLLIALVSEAKGVRQNPGPDIGWLWFEVKLVSLFVLLFFFLRQRSRLFHCKRTNLRSVVVLYNACGFADQQSSSSQNSITWLVGHYRRYESKKPFQKALLWRIYALVAAEVILVFFAFVFAAAGHRVALMAIPFVAAGLYLLYLYLRRFRRTVNDLGLVVGAD